MKEFFSVLNDFDIAFIKCLVMFTLIVALGVGQILIKMDLKEIKNNFNKKKK